MTHYTHVAADGKGLGVWEITEAEVRRADGALVKYPRPIDLDVVKNIESTVAFSTVYELALAPGQSPHGKAFERASKRKSRLLP